MTLWKEYDFLQDFFDSSVVGRISPKALVIIGGKISFLLPLPHHCITLPLGHLRMQNFEFDAGILQAVRSFTL